MEHNSNLSFSPPRKSRRRNVAPLRIGPDPAATLPEYDQTLRASLAWTRPRELDEEERGEEGFSDRPPDYPDSAEEADEETELDNDDPNLQHQQVLTQYTRPSSQHKHSFSNPFPHTASPRRHKRFAQQQGNSSLSRPPTTAAHKRRHSSVAVLKSRTDSAVDSYLDTLLERSVHALEMSNALLESSISTQATMSSLFSGPDCNSGNAESALEARAIGLSSTLLRNWDVQEDWAQQLDRIRQGVDSLLTDDPVEAEPISQSVPPSPSPLGDMSQASTDDLIHRPSPQLRLAPQDRSSLVSPPPRAMTMYIDAPSTISSPTFPRESGWASPELDRSLNSSINSFMLPATLGTRPPQPTLHAISGLFGSSILTAASSTSNLLPSSSRTPEALEPQLSANPVEPSTPAYNMLANLAARSSAVNLNTNASASSSTLTLPLPSSQTPVSMANDKQRRASNATASAPSSFVSSFLSGVASLRRRNSSPPPIVPSIATSPPSRPSRSTQPPSSFHSPKTKRRSVSADQSSLGTSSSRSSRSSSRTRALRTPSHHVRELTPPPEGTDEEASSSSDGFVAKQSMASLRRILDEQPPPPQPPPNDDDRRSNASSTTTKLTSFRKPPAFMPRTPVVAPLAGTSTATASISRLFTKGVHTSSTRPRSPPLKSVMKRRNLEGDGSVGTPSPSPSVSSFGALTSQTPPTIVQPEQSSASDSGDVPQASMNGKGKGREHVDSNSSLTPFGGFGNIGTLVSRVLLSRSTPASRLHTPPSSGTSTPKRISFAALPESYSSTKAEGEAGSVNRKRKEASERRRRRRGGKGGQNQSSSDDEGMRSDRSWWAGWLSGGGDAYGGYGNVRDRERVEDRATRRMGMSMGMGGGGHMSVLDEWGV